MNKVDPVNRLKDGKKVWISGLMRFQNANRANMQIFEQKKLLKFYPIIDMKEDDISLYNQVFELPNNPLVYQGFGSIGCTHCTSRGEGREGRWINSIKQNVVYIPRWNQLNVGSPDRNVIESGSTVDKLKTVSRSKNLNREALTTPTSTRGIWIYELKAFTHLVHLRSQE